VFARYKAGKGLSAYTEVSRTKQTFDHLASLYAGDRKGKELLTLVEARRKDAPGDRSLPAWEAEARGLAGGYAGALKLLEGHREGVFADGHPLWKVRDRRVRCLARLKRTAEALKEARSGGAGGDADSPLLVAVVHALAGEVPQTEAALREAVRRFFSPVT